MWSVTAVTVLPRLARNTIIESTFDVGRRFRCTIEASPRITVRRGLTVKILGCFGLALPQQLSFLAVQLRCIPTLSCSLDYLQIFIQQGRGVFNSPSDLARCGEEGRVTRNSARGR
jgi:hypothetical protein